MFISDNIFQCFFLQMVKKIEFILYLLIFEEVLGIINISSKTLQNKVHLKVFQFFEMNFVITKKVKFYEQ